MNATVAANGTNATNGTAGGGGVAGPAGPSPELIAARKKAAEAAVEATEAAAAANQVLAKVHEATAHVQKASAAGVNILKVSGNAEKRGKETGKMLKYLSPPVME